MFYIQLIVRIERIIYKRRTYISKKISNNFISYTSIFFKWA